MRGSGERNLVGRKKGRLLTVDPNEKYHIAVGAFMNAQRDWNIRQDEHLNDILERVEMLETLASAQIRDILMIS